MKVRIYNRKMVGMRALLVYTVNFTLHLSISALFNNQASDKY